MKLKLIFRYPLSILVLHRTVGSDYEHCTLFSGRAWFVPPLVVYTFFVWLHSLGLKTVYKYLRILPLNVFQTTAAHLPVTGLVHTGV